MQADEIDVNLQEHGSAQRVAEDGAPSYARNKHADDDGVVERIGGIQLQGVAANRAGFHCQGESSETILIVEDNEGVREVAAEFLEELGYSVIVAEDGPSALMILTRRNDIDLLFTDIVLPGGVMGTQLAERARQLRADLPVVFTTGFASPDVLQDSAVDATHLVLSKPYRKADLATMVRSALDRCEPLSQAVATETIPLKKMA